jgi:hypothetical protein
MESVSISFRGWNIIMGNPKIYFVANKEIVLNSTAKEMVGKKLYCEGVTPEQRNFWLNNCITCHPHWDDYV